MSWGRGCDREAEVLFCAAAAPSVGSHGRHFNSPDERGEEIIGRREWGSVSPENSPPRWEMTVSVCRAIFHRRNLAKVELFFRGFDSDVFLRNQFAFHSELL